MGSSATTPSTSRAFGSAGSLTPEPSGRGFGDSGPLTVDSPSLLARRDAVSRLATENRQERNLFKRAFRNLNRLSRRGDAQASLAALDLMDRARENNIQMSGIPNAGKEFDAAAIRLRDEQQFNADVQGLVTPNETLATTNLPDEPATVGTGTGIAATRNVPGPSAAQGGPLSSRPIWSSRDAQGGPSLSPIGAADTEALNALATPGVEDPTMPFYSPGGEPSRALVVPEQYGGGIGIGEDLDQQFRRRYPNSSRLLERAAPAPTTASFPTRREMDRAGGRPASLLDKLRKNRLPGLDDNERLSRAEQISRIA